MRPSGNFAVGFVLMVSTMIGTLQPSFAQELDPALENQRRRQLEQRTNALGNFERRGGAQDPGPAQASAGPCFQINTLTVEGATRLRPAQLAKIIGKYVPNCMQGADIQAAMRDLDAAYADKGYITSKTYIPPQNLTDGSLVLSMLEGTVEDILLIDTEKQIESNRGKRQLKTAFPRAKGELFQLRDFEQGLDQMNRLASVEAVLRLQPGEQPGGSYVVVQRLQKDRVRGYARWDNQGARSTGRDKLSFDLEVDDLFGANDSWVFGYSGSENTNALSIYGSIPYGYWTFSTDLSYSEYLVPLNTLSELFGTSTSVGFNANYVASRGQNSTTELGFGIKARRSNRYINDLRLTPQNLTTLSATAKHIRLGERARNSYDMTLSFGSKHFGADEDDTSLSSDIPRAQFVKVSAGWQRQGALGNLGTLVTDLRLQWSTHTLYGAEQLSLGSYSSVRGYEASVASGDKGAYVRNDLYLNPKIWNFLPDEWAAKIAQKTQLHLFLDAGVTHDHARKSTEKAAGFGIGMSYYHKQFTLSGIVGAPLMRDNKYDIGSPVVQIRLDLKVF